MTPDLAVGLIAGLFCSWAALSALWVWWRLRTVERGMRQTSWDLEALAGALRKREEQGH